MIEITYIWHDCFVVDTESATIVFDYWKDVTVPHKSLPRFIENCDGNKTLYVVVSHFHKDHYSKSIFEWGGKFRNIVYIISKDVARHARHILNPDSIYTGKKPVSDNVVILEPGQKYSDENLMIEAFDSTDIGNSYYVETEGKSIFHAGDLNAWVWMDESTEEEIEKSLEDYRKILKMLSDRHPTIDYVMFPVDSRIGTGYYTGASLFVREIDVKHFFPMHFELWTNEEERKRYHLGASDFKLYANRKRGEYISLRVPYSSFVSYD